jgi:lipopolysaccharide/colanic/teichoic acid biosynthesis glycosyltransferase
MTRAKRLTDLALALALGALILLPSLALAALLWAVQGRPILHRSERIGMNCQPFGLWKFRTMAPDPTDGGVSGGDKASRVTPLGHSLRRLRLDEIPQLWNILRGEMSFVGPRPPLPHYVERFPGLYARVLRSRPGLTGLATLHFHAREARLLAACRSPGETDAVYVRRCVPRKARLDLIYQHRRSLALDLALIAATIVVVLAPRRHP